MAQHENIHYIVADVEKSDDITRVQAEIESRFSCFFELDEIAKIVGIM
ncbi:hypothetical protein [Necropsobacter massiliensis]|nr:hypothetical protein [Necropsobacter massiliensis]